MPILPLMDALILLGWSSLLTGFLLKAVYITTHYRPTLLGLTPIDFLMVSIVCLLFALTLAARTWVKALEPELLARRRRARALARLAYEEAQSESVAGEEVAARGAVTPASTRSAAGL